MPIVVNDALSKITSDDIQKIIERALADSRADGEAQSGQSSQVDTREIVADVLQQIQASGGLELASSEVENLVIQAAAEQPSRPPTAIPTPTEAHSQPSVATTVPSATQTLLPSPTTIPDPTQAPTSTPTPTYTPIPTATPRPTPTPTATPTPIPTATPIPAPIHVDVSSLPRDAFGVAMVYPTNPGSAAWDSLHWNTGFPRSKSRSGPIQGDPTGWPSKWRRSNHWEITVGEARR